jgi:hypothetical protein
LPGLKKKKDNVVIRSSVDMDIPKGEEQALVQHPRML